MSLSIAAILASAGASLEGAVIAPFKQEVKQREMKRRFGASGSATTKGKRTRSLKVRANRRKAKAKVK